MVKRFTQVLGPAFQKPASTIKKSVFERTEPAKVYGFPYLDYFQVFRGGRWHTCRQILNAKDGLQCERLIHANSGGYRILRISVKWHNSVAFTIRYTVECR